MNWSWNWFFRSILIGPIIRLLFPLTIEGLEKLPKDRPAILAIGPHSTELESGIIASHLWKLDARFYIKASYVRGRSFVATFMRLSGQIPIDRLDGGAMDEAIDMGVTELITGRSLLVYPEGTRYYDGLLHPGGPVVTRTAYRAYLALRKLHREPADVYPVGSQGFLRVQPEGSKFPRPFVRAKLVIGDPMVVRDYMPPKALRVLMNERAIETRTSGALRKAMMDNIAANAETSHSTFRSEIKES